jgi:hypothetical protein
MVLALLSAVQSANEIFWQQDFLSVLSQNDEAFFVSAAHGLGARGCAEFGEN